MKEQELLYLSKGNYNTTLDKKLSAYMESNSNQFPMSNHDVTK